MPDEIKKGRGRPKGAKSKEPVLGLTKRQRWTSELWADVERAAALVGETPSDFVREATVIRCHTLLPSGAPGPVKKDGFTDPLQASIYEAYSSMSSVNLGIVLARRGAALDVAFARGYDGDPPTGVHKYDRTSSAFAAYTAGKDRKKSEKRRRDMPDAVTMAVAKELQANGFVATTYKGQDGVFYVKKNIAQYLPYVREHVVDGEFICGEMEALTEVMPGNEIQMHIPYADYIEGPWPLDSDEGRALLRDAFAAPPGLTGSSPAGADKSGGDDAR